MKTNNTPTYLAQYHKITRAYLNNELNPYDGCACFVGNLLNNKCEWEWCRTISKKKVIVCSENINREGLKVINEESCGLYSIQDIAKLEENFLSVLNNNTIEASTINAVFSKEVKSCSNYENALYEAMISTLELLKQIHQEKGEDVDAPKLEKRILQTI